MSSDLKRETLGSWMKSCNFLGIKHNELGRQKVLGGPIFTLAGDKIKKDSVYGLTDEILKALSATVKTEKSMKSDTDVLTVSKT